MMLEVFFFFNLNSFKMNCRRRHLPGTVQAQTLSRRSFNECAVSLRVKILPRDFLLLFFGCFFFKAERMLDVRLRTRIRVADSNRLMSNDSADSNRVMSNDSADSNRVMSNDSLLVITHTL